MAAQRRLKQMALLLVPFIIITILLVFVTDTGRELYKRIQDVSFNIYASNSPKVVPQTLGDFADFQFLINPDVCGDSAIDMLIVIGSNPKNFKLRNVLRQTLGQPGIEGKSFKIVFPFGYIANVTRQLFLLNESDTYSDIIQGNFNDSYRNVTFRDLMGLRWAWKYCPRARFIMRLDDDTSVDIYRVIKAVEGHALHLMTTIACFYVWTNATVFRYGEYALTREEHLNDFFEPYCGGWMYVLTPQMAYILDLASLKVKPYWMNDAYITGTLVSAVGNRPLDLNLERAWSTNDLVKSMDTWPPKYVLGHTGGDPNLTSIFHYKYKTFAMMQNYSSSQ